MSTTLYKIVHFVTDDTIAIVPKAWIFKDTCGKIDKSYWPSTDGTKLAKGLKERDPKWRSYKIDILYSADDWESAKVKLNKARVESAAEGNLDGSSNGSFITQRNNEQRRPRSSTPVRHGTSPDLTVAEQTLIRSDLHKQCCCSEVKNQLAQVLEELGELRREMMRRPQNGGEEAEETLLFDKIEDIEEYREFEQRLSLNKDERKKLAKFLKGFLESTPGGSARCMMRAIASNAVWERYTLGGKLKSKGKFKRSSVYKVIFKLIEKHNSSNSSKIDAVIDNVLRQASVGDGGSKQKRKNTDRERSRQESPPVSSDSN